LEQVLDPAVEPEVKAPAPAIEPEVKAPAPAVEPEVKAPAPAIEPEVKAPAPATEPEVKAPAPATEPEVKAPELGQSSLGLKFVPAGTPDVLFSIYNTRIQDFQAFVDSTGYVAASVSSSVGQGWKERGASWKKPGFPQGPDHPVVGISWVDAKAFCKWLTTEEQKAHRLGDHQHYRLPTDAEWSTAVGLQENPDDTPANKDGQVQGIYPWGTEWPRPDDAGHFGLKGTKPVGAYKPNRFGLYDLGGNVWQWCEDAYKPEEKSRVLRGGTWGYIPQVFHLASLRHFDDPEVRGAFYGFRIVLALK
jgi:hypothetical protein